MSGYAGKAYWIIGASSGIGAALAKELASRGAQLALSARNGDALDALCRNIGGQAKAYPADVTDVDALQAVFGKLTAEWPRVDGVIMLAGTYTPKSIADMDLAEAKRIVEVNFTGCLNVAHVVLPHLRRQRYGLVGLCASVAGYRGLPNGQPYCATKAAVMNFAETLRIEEARNGIDVRVICPGFVHTPMTAKNEFEMPMAISAEEAAIHIADGLQTSAFEIHFPKRFTFLMKLLRNMPHRLFFKIAAQIKS